MDSLVKDNIDNYTFGEKIKELRIGAGLTQGEVAEKLNVTPGFISNVENGRTAMTLRLLIYYAKLIGVSVDSIVGFVDEEYKETSIDNELSREIRKMTVEQKKKLLKILKVING